MSVIKNIDFLQDGFHLNIPLMEVLDQGVTALIGPSGSGKSTLIRVLLGLEHLKNWSWVINGVDQATLPTEKRNFGVVFQTLELFPHMTAKENILFPLECRGKISTENSKRASDLIQRLGLNSAVDRKPNQLSGGERQRVALARALVFKPKFLFLDEPFSSLDEDQRINSRNLVKEILSEYQIPALLVSHDRSDIEVLSDQAYRIENGKLNPN
jgi:ABC-type Fe3+/spermidine/putrescine transport system ATPase subunit